VDSGTIHMHLTQWLKDKDDVTVVTNNLLFAIKAVDEVLLCEVIFIHGSVKKPYKSQEMNPYVYLMSFTLMLVSLP
jgi:DeoR/GlpR family transcriptional regulator of sugar metabolism